MSIVEVDVQGNMTEKEYAATFKAGDIVCDIYKITTTGDKEFREKNGKFFQVKEIAYGASLKVSTTKKDADGNIVLPASEIRQATQGERQKYFNGTYE